MDAFSCSTSDKSREGVRMVLKKPGKSGIPLTHEYGKDKEQKEQYVIVLGPESEHTRRALKQAQRRIERTENDKDQSDDEIAAEVSADARMLSKLTVGGEICANLTEDPKADPLWHKVDKDLAFSLYKSVMPFRAQALSFMLDMGNFTKE